MPAKSKKNYRAMAHSDGLSELATRTHKSVVRGAFVSVNDLNALIELANNLKKELFPALAANTLDPFLVEEPKSDVTKLPTVKAPAVQVEPVKEPEPAKKSGFLGRN